MKCRLIPAVFLATLAILSAGAQSSFEVLSIRPAPANRGPRTPVQIDAGRVTYNNITVKSMIQIAYGIPDWKLTGEPEWAGSLPYDIKGTFPAGAGADQLPNMLKSMLTERFGLVAQYQSRIADVYSLTQVKTGAKLKPAVSGDQWSPDGTMKGGIFRGRLVLHNLTMAALAELLARQLGRPVLDQTGLSEAFDITLKWSPLETTAPTPADDAPSIFAALQEQLGLRLQSAKAPVEMLVIKQVNQPSQN